MQSLLFFRFIIFRFVFERSDIQYRPRNMLCMQPFLIMYFLVENPVKCVNEKEKIIPIGFYILPYHFTKKIATIFLTVFFREIGQSKKKKVFQVLKLKHNNNTTSVLSEFLQKILSALLLQFVCSRRPQLDLNSIRSRFENSYVVKRQAVLSFPPPLLQHSELF